MILTEGELNNIIADITSTIPPELKNIIRGYGEHPVYLESVTRDVKSLFRTEKRDVYVINDKVLPFRFDLIGETTNGTNFYFLLEHKSIGELEISGFDALTNKYESYVTYKLSNNPVTNNVYLVAGTKTSLWFAETYNDPREKYTNNASNMLKRFDYATKKIVEYPQIKFDSIAINYDDQIAVVVDVLSETEQQKAFEIAKKLSPPPPTLEQWERYRDHYKATLSNLKPTQYIILYEKNNRAVQNYLSELTLSPLSRIVGEYEYYNLVGMER
jgi:hypothetical protein